MDAVLKAVYRKDRDEILKLSRKRALNQRDEDGRTPLMHAVLAEDADPDIVRLLIDCGVEVNARDSGQSWTALHFAARDQKPEVVEVLLEKGAEVDAEDSFGNTPLWRSVLTFGPGQGMDTVALLLRAGANPKRKNRHDVSPIDLARTKGAEELALALERG